MPENEIKYVLTGYAELETLFTPFGWEDIEQAYLNPNNRLRRITEPNGKQHHLIGFKQRLPNGHNLDIMGMISAADFSEAWNYASSRLRKRRIPIEHRNLKWDIDFYRWKRPYFVLAEVEMPPHMERPDSMLPYLEPYLAYEVPRDDDRFTARRLADEDYVATLAQELMLTKSAHIP